MVGSDRAAKRARKPRGTSRYARPGTGGPVSVQPDLQAVLDAVRILSPSSRSPVHGEDHWRRVATNGLDLAAEVGADPLLIVLFGIFHDSMRFSEHRDDGHGRRGGFLARRLNAELMGLSDV